MTRGGVAGSALGTIVLGAILLRTAVPPSVSPAAPTGAPPKASSELAAGATKVNNKGNRLEEDGPWKASQEHFAGMFPGGGCPPSATGGADQKPVASLSGVTLFLQQGQQTPAISDPRKQLWCIPDGEPVRAMIAMAPDPAHTHMALVFDRTVEAIQLAAGSAHYVIDRYWLPWDMAPKSEWADYDSFQRESKDRRKKDDQPGLLMFRWDGEKDNANANVSTLYVFLVADTSTAGINGRQFSKAVGYLQEVCGMTGRPGPGCADSSAIHIVGPTFSGSLASMRRLVEVWSPQEFIVYSGTVSSLCAQENQHLLKKPSSLCDPYPRPDYKPAPHLHFRSLVTDTESAREQFINLLTTRRDIKCNGSPEVAILSEAATTYGEATGDRLYRGTIRDRQRCYTSFVYPREISSLRNASQPAANQGAAGASNGAAASPYLSFNLADQTNRSDEPPDFSSQQGPLSKEAVLMNYGAEMRRDHYKYIGINGSNVLDVLFLSNFLRTAVPDARLFIFDSDLLQERDLDNAPFIGTLAITTHPLFGRNLDWVQPAPRLSRLPFSDQFEEGQYNASVLTIQEMLGMKQEDSGTYECGGPDCSQLPLWLTAVGTGGYWPIQVFCPDSGGGSVPTCSKQPAQNNNVSDPKQPDPRQLQDQDFSPAWKAIGILLFILAVLHVLILLTTSPVKQHFRDFAFVSAASGQRLFFIDLASATLALALAMTAEPVLDAPLGKYAYIVVGAALGMVGLLFACICLHLNHALRWQSERQSAKAEPSVPRPARELLIPIVGCVSVWVIALVLGGSWWTLFKSDPSEYGFFFAYRNVHLATGVSPLTPILILLAGVYLWSIFEVWRLRFNDKTRPHIETKVPVDRTSAEQNVADAIKEFRLKNGYLAGFVVTYLLWVIFLDPMHPFHLFERPVFGRIYEVLLCVVVLLLLSKGFRLGQIWSDLRRFLFQLEVSPIRFAFNRLKGFSWSPIWRQGGEEAEWVDMTRSFEAMRRLGNADVDQDGKLRRLSASAREKATIVKAVVTKLKGQDAPSWPVFRSINGYRNRNQSSSDEIFLEFEDSLAHLQQNLAEFLEVALEILKPHWDSNGSDDVEAGEPAENQQVVVHCHPEKPDPDMLQAHRLEEYAALRYVAFIRGVLAHMRHSLIFLAISFSLVLISLNVYSFEPHQALIWSFTAIFVVIGFIIVLVLVQVHRDHTLSRITGTTPNELGVQFYVRIASIGALPLLTLLATHFPSIGRFLASFLQPGLEALK